MKVILLQDVSGQGKKGDLINVSDGYGRNFLLPRKLAKLADAGSIQQIEAREESKAFHFAESKKKAEETKAFLADKTLVYKTTGGADGRLYSAVTAKDISEKIKSDLGLDIDKRDITVAETIKLVGEYNVRIKLFQGVSTDLKLVVEA